MSFNSTGLDSIKAEYIRDLYNMTRCDFISIQEHFKKTKFVKTTFPNMLAMLYLDLEKLIKIVEGQKGELHR